jgi:putative ubiquitin-RnfH superfamily antitoxin RatB of RatAB toxin-antitoxin module
MLIILNGLIVFCKAQDIAALRKDPDIIAIRKVTDKLKARYYKMPPNMSALQIEIAKNPTPENMKQVLKKNGMVDADKFVDDIALQRSSMVRFNKKHPEFMKMEMTKRIEIMRKLLTD